MLTPNQSGGTTLVLLESGFETEGRRQQNDSGWDEELGELVELLAA